MADAKAAAERLERRLDEQLQAAARARNMTIGIGVVLIVIVVGYFSWINSQVQQIKINDLVDMAIGQVEARLPEIRQTVTNQVEQNANQILGQAVDTVTARIPQARKQIESYATAQFADILGELRTQLNEYVDFALQDKHDTINEFMENLDTDAEAAAVEDQLYEIIKESIDTSTLRSDLRTYGAALTELAEKVDRLVANDNLTDSERIERDILIALKVMAHRE